MMAILIVCGTLTKSKEVYIFLKKKGDVVFVKPPRAKCLSLKAELCPHPAIFHSSIRPLLHFLRAKTATATSHEWTGDRKMVGGKKGEEDCLLLIRRLGPPHLLGLVL